MVGWLEGQGLIIDVYYSGKWGFDINSFEGIGTYPSRKEATLAAIDAALEYLSLHRFSNI